MESTSRFIIKPHFFDVNNTSFIEYTDVLTYVAVRSFSNRQNNCFPALITIAERAGVSKKFITKSIDRLGESNHLSVLKASKKHISNRYVFPKVLKFDKVPYDIFEHKLTLHERSMLLCLRELCITDTDVLGSINFLSDRLHISYKTLYQQLNNLKAKDFIEERSDSSRKLRIIDWEFNGNTSSDGNGLAKPVFLLN